MKEPPAASRRLLTVLAVVGPALACGDALEPEPEPTVASVELTSPIGALLDVGGGAQLDAAAKDRAGDAVGAVSFTWTSSDPTVVTVGAAGFIRALAVGTATIVAEAGGVSASLALRVVDADLPRITTLVTDPFMVALVELPSGDLGTRLQSAVADCEAGAAAGRLEGIRDCVDVIRAEAAVAGPAARPVLAVLMLFADEIERLLNL